MSTDIAQIVSLSPQDPTHCVGSWPDMGTAGLDKAIRRARNAFAQGQGDSGHDRAKLLVRAAERVEGDAPELVSLAVVETGRPVAEARAEVQRVADTLRYYAQVALDCEGEMFPPTRASSWVLSQRRPRGVLGVISPWNFPFAIPAWKIAPALAYGNAVVFKPSREALGCAERLVAALGVGELVQLVTLGPETETILPSHRGLDAVTFTGSTRGGRAVVAAASAAGSVVQAEMGGHNASIVLPDANIEGAAKAIAFAAMSFSGQKCTSTRRVICVGSRAALEEALVEEVRKLKQDDPAHDDTVLGPVIGAPARSAVLDVVRIEQQRGARVLTGGGSLDRPGWYVEPTILAKLEPDSSFLAAETFGPICAILTASDEKAAATIANGTEYGIVAALYTADIGRILDIAARLDVGILRVNEPSTGLDFNVPFAGHKASGYGLGEQARAARDLFTTSTTICISRP